MTSQQNRIAEYLVTRGQTETHFYLASGALAGVGQLDPEEHPYQGGSFDGGAYQRRYGLPADGQLYHPAIKAEMRTQLDRACNEAAKGGWFLRVMGLEVHPTADGSSPLTVEEMDDLNFCGGETLQDLWRNYGPASHQTETPPPPRHPAPTGMDAARFPERHSLFEWTAADLAAHNIDPTTPAGRLDYYSRTAGALTGRVSAGRARLDAQPADGDYTFFTVDAVTMLQLLGSAGRAAQGNPVEVDRAPGPDGVSLVRVEAPRGPALLNRDEAVSLAARLLSFAAA